MVRPRPCMSLTACGHPRDSKLTPFRPRHRRSASSDFLPEHATGSPRGGTHPERGCNSAIRCVPPSMLTGRFDHGLASLSPAHPRRRGRCSPSVFCSPCTTSACRRSADFDDCRQQRHDQLEHRWCLTNPPLTLLRGKTYDFVMQNVSADPPVQHQHDQHDRLGQPVQRRRHQQWRHRHADADLRRAANAPDSLHYNCGNHAAMNGPITILTDAIFAVGFRLNRHSSGRRHAATVGSKLTPRRRMP